jgi:hypothetical protein
MPAAHNPPPDLASGNHPLTPGGVRPVFLTRLVLTPAPRSSVFG